LNYSIETDTMAELLAEWLNNEVGLSQVSEPLYDSGCSSYGPELRSNLRHLD